MYLIKVRNVNEALPRGCSMMIGEGLRRDSRNGQVLQLPMPLTTLYSHPRERVLFAKERDANPFFHFFESLWMLAGRNDVEFVAKFVKSIAQFSDDGETFDGAYGFRWRRHFNIDQLQMIADVLQREPSCRRQVLSMWDGWHDLGAVSKDLPCNTHVYLQRGDVGELNMMVCNRSNDLIWGAYGADAVHLSVVQEYVAALIGCDVGAYWQTSMNTHAYLGRHEALLREMPYTVRQAGPYASGEVEPLPLVSIPHGRWKRELDTLMEVGTRGKYLDPTFDGVAVPMLLAHESCRRKKFNKAAKHIEDCQASDWQLACLQWIRRREARWTSKNA